jgi:hypothetical protein
MPKDDQYGRNVWQVSMGLIKRVVVDGMRLGVFNMMSLKGMNSAKQNLHTSSEHPFGRPQKGK